MESRTRSRTPAAASTSGGDSRRSRGGRRPLADCTNTVTPPCSSSAAITPKPKRKPPPKSNPPPASETEGISLPGDAKTCSSGGVPLASTHSSAAPEPRDSTDFWEPWTVYTRRNTAEKRKHKGKATAASASRSSVKELWDIGDKFNVEREGNLSKSCPIPVTKRQKCHRPGSDGEYNALEDYIKQQKSYFAEVDAFDLLEEEVSPGNGSD